MAIYGKSTGNIILNGDRLKTFSLRSEQDKLPSLITSVSIVLEVPARAIRQIKRN